MTALCFQRSLWRSSVFRIERLFLHALSFGLIYIGPQQVEGEIYDGVLPLGKLLFGGVDLAAACRLDAPLDALFVGVQDRTGREPDAPAVGISDEKGRPPPPPVLAPATTTLGSDFITDVKSLAALKHERLVSNTIGPQ